MPFPLYPKAIFSQDGKFEFLFRNKDLMLKEYYRENEEYLRIQHLKHPKGECLGGFFFILKKYRNTYNQ